MNTTRQAFSWSTAILLARVLSSRWARRRSAKAGLLHTNRWIGIAISAAGDRIVGHTAHTLGQLAFA